VQRHRGPLIAGAAVMGLAFGIRMLRRRGRGG
jgi:hypothetical protein